MAQLEQLEEDIPEYSEVHLRDHLLAHLRPEIHQEVLTRQEPPLTWLELIALAMRAEEMIWSNKERQVPNHQSDNKEWVSSKPFGYHKGKPPVGSPNVTASVTLSPSWNSGGNPHHPDKGSTGDWKDKKNVTCWGCNQTGHYQSKCTQWPISVNTVKGKSSETKNEKTPS